MPPFNNALEPSTRAVTSFASSSWPFVPKRKRRAGYTLAASASQARLRARFAAQRGVMQIKKMIKLASQCLAICPIYLFANSSEFQKYFEKYGKPEFEFHSISKNSNDTLEIVTCGETVYFPFGKLKPPLDLSRSLLKEFKQSESTYIEEPLTIWKYKLNLKESWLDLYFDNNQEGAIASYVIGGKIINKNIRFENGISVGLTRKELFEKILKKYDVALFNKLKTVTFIPCVDGVKQIIRINDKKIIEISFK